MGEDMEMEWSCDVKEDWVAEGYEETGKRNNRRCICRGEREGDKIVLREGAE